MLPGNRPHRHLDGVEPAVFYSTRNLVFNCLHEIPVRIQRLVMSGFDLFPKPKYWFKLLAVGTFVAFQAAQAWSRDEKRTHSSAPFPIPVATPCRPRSVNPYCTRRSIVIFSTSTRRLGSRQLIKAGSFLSVQTATGSASPLPWAFKRFASMPRLAR